MAKKDKTDLSFLNQALNSKLASNIQDNFDSSYKKTYYSDNKDAKYIEAMRRMIDKDLNGLMDRNKLRNDGHSISTLYARTLALHDDDALMEFKQALQDETMLADIMDLYSQNSLQRDLDREIDVVCKYMPKLDQALDIKADHVLYSERFDGQSIKITPITNEKGSVAGVSSTDINQYAAKSDLEAFKKKYNLQELTKEIYTKTAKYGESMVYILDYSRGLGRLLKKTQNSQLLAESVILQEDFDNMLSSVNESFSVAYGDHETITSSGLIDNTYFSDEVNIDNLLESDDWEDIEIEINTTGVIPGIIFEEQNGRRIIKEAQSIINEYDNDNVLLNEAKGHKLGTAGNAMLSNNSYLSNMRQEFKNFNHNKPLRSPERLNVDGFTNRTGTKKEKQEAINVPGCIVRLLDHTMVKTIRMDETVLGYYFIECNRDLDMNQTTFSSTLGGLRPRRTTREKEVSDNGAMDDQVLQKIARQIAKKIDAKFVNSNQDLAKEIYTILKYNADHGNNKVSKIRVSFIPPEDIIHVYFDINKKTWRGKSDLYRSLFQAKLYSCLYISNTLAILTRGFDKRIYRVRQTVDTNIQAVLLSVINQIKQSNFNLRQIENMNNILNITGRFNDLVIPQNVDGQSAVDFDILPAQNIDTKDGLMTMLEEMAVNSTGVSVEMVNNRLQEQTATQITMTNSRFLLKIRERQVCFQEFLSRIYTKIYQCEYGIEDELEVFITPPVMLNFTNSNQILAAANETINSIVLMKMGANTQDEALKAQFTSGLMEYYFKSILPMDDINKIWDNAQIEYENSKERIAMKMSQQQQGFGGGQ